MPAKRNKAKKPTETSMQRQRRLLQEQRAAKAQQAKPAAKPAAKPTSQGTRRGAAPTKPTAKDGRQPRALTNTKSPTMRQIRAKAIQARRQAQGKSTVASRQQGITPDSARGQRIRQMAKGQRVMGDSGQVRAAQQRGKQEAAKAQTRRNARAASQRMAGKLAMAGAKRMLGGMAGRAGLAGVAAEGLTARNTADGTLSAAMKRGDYKPKQGPASKTTQASFNKKTFDQAFKAARTSGAKTFTWRGKKYTTNMK